MKKSENIAIDWKGDLSKQSPEEREIRISVVDEDGAERAISEEEHEAARLQFSERLCREFAHELARLLGEVSERELTFEECLETEKGRELLHGIIDHIAEADPILGIAAESVHAIVDGAD